nr:MAG TPA: Replicative helicase [Caudoviricetes sp.]
MDFMEMLAKRNPNMQRILTETRKKREEDLKEARDHLGEIQEALGLGNDHLSDDDLLEAAKAVWMMNQKAYDCHLCTFTVENCDMCKYTNIVARSNKYLRDDYFAPCSMYKTNRKLREVSRLMNASGLGDRFKQRRFETFKTDKNTAEAKLAAERFCNELQSNPKATGLMLVGPYGCGKTHLAASIVHRCAEFGIAGVFVVVPELLARIRTSYRTGDGKAEAVIDTAKSAKLLILDDLGAEKASEWVKEQLYMLVNYRYEHMLPTVVTTNCSGAELEQELGRRTLSRLVEMTKPVNIRAGDYRMKLAASR